LDESARGDYAALIGGAELELSIVQIPERIGSQIKLSDPPQARESTPIKLVFLVPSIDKTWQPLGFLAAA
jgi:hypothetical protein